MRSRHPTRTPASTQAPDRLRPLHQSINRPLCNDKTGIKGITLGLQPYGIHVERLNQGQPIIQPTDHWWEGGVTFNAASVYLERSPENDPLIRRLLDQEDLNAPELSEGVVVVHYRARPKSDPGYRWNRSFIGL